MGYNGIGSFIFMVQPFLQITLMEYAPTSSIDRAILYIKIVLGFLLSTVYHHYSYVYRYDISTSPEESSNHAPRLNHDASKIRPNFLGGLEGLGEDPPHETSQTEGGAQSHQL